MGNEDKLTPEQFVMRAIETLRNPDKSTGIHTVFYSYQRRLCAVASSSSRAC